LGKEFSKVLDERKAAYYQICAHEGCLKALEWHTRVVSEQAGRVRAEEHIRNAAAKEHKQLCVAAVKMQSGQLKQLAYSATMQSSPQRRLVDKPKAEDLTIDAAVLFGRRRSIEVW
jgi:hypothetical protein